MSKYFDFSAQPEIQAFAANESNLPPQQLLEAIGHEDTYIRCGYIPHEERSREVHDSVEEAFCELENPDSRTVIAAYGLDDPQFIDWSLSNGVFFWEFEQALLGQVLPSWLQTIGDCVSFGAGRATNDVIIIGAVNSGGATVYTAAVATEPIYAGSRVEIGGGKLSGDGSIGIWAAQWLLKYGALLRQNYGAGDLDLTTYSGQRARAWGARNHGCPDSLEPIAKQHPITGSTPVKDTNSAVAFVTHLNPITIASNRGFTKQRNAEGICDPAGSWSHQMCIRGVCKLKSGKLVFIIQNSWGDYLGSTNNVITTASGRTVTLPQGAFAADADVVNRDIFQKGDCNAFAGINGWGVTQRQFAMMNQFTEMSA